MTTITKQLALCPANDVAGEAKFTSRNLASQRAERRLMLVIAFLTVAVLVSSLANGYTTYSADRPDLATFAGRV